MGCSLQLRATHTVRTRQVISKYDSPIRVGCCAVRGSSSFYGNQVLSWMKTRGKQTKMTKWGVKLNSIQAQLWYYPNQSQFGLAKFECEGRRSATAGMLDAPYPWCI